jgi:hypothetical protein
MGKPRCGIWHRDESPQRAVTHRHSAHTFTIASRMTPLLLDK